MVDAPTTSGGFGAPGASYSYVPLELYYSIANTERKLAGIHMGLKEHSVNPLYSRSPHRHARGITAQALVLGTVSEHQRLVPNPSRLISVRGRNAIWWVMKPSPSRIPIHYHSSRLSPSSTPLHHIPPIIPFRHSPKHPSFLLIVVLLLLLLLCPPSPLHRLMYRPCSLPLVPPSPCRPTRVVALQSPG